MFSPRNLSPFTFHVSRTTRAALLSIREEGIQEDSMDTLSLLNGLRFVDSFFPSGGYAFSSGLEAAVQGGAIRNARHAAGGLHAIVS